MATKWTQESIVLKLQELHPNLDFSEFIFTKVDNKSIVICPIHGPREMKPMNLLRGNSCKLCRPQSQKRTPLKIIEQFNEVHSNKYTYPNFERYINQNQIIDIICPEHGKFEQQIIHHNNGSGCLKCHDRTFNRKDLDSHILSIPDEQKLLYNYLSIDYNYMDSGQTFLEIECKKCSNIFFQNLSNHKYGSGCPECARIDFDSKGIKSIKKYLKDLNIEYINEKTFDDCRNISTNKLLRFDFYIESMNCCIEFDGPQHFKAADLFGGKEEFERIILRDNIKNEYCRSNNINLIRIKYNENIESILNERLKVNEYK